ncbi:uncharacterized protein [Amphiura filiformis]|uniref:uncharacterized protein n=1 Tax=Amphiura filiformis TaxID=82378 RepID=UPI003B20D99C
MMAAALTGDGNGKDAADTASISSRGSLSMDDDWCVVTEASINKELVLDMENPNDVAQLAASYISRQLMQIAAEDMTADIVDKIFKVLKEVGEMDDQILQSFILEFINEQEVWDKQRKKGDDDSKTSHRGVIMMLLELLRFSPVPVENNVLWVKLLAKLGLQFPEDIPIMIDLKVAATIMGTMAVHSNIVQIQEHGCRVLEAMAKFKPTPTLKAPVRESGIQVLVMAIEKHHYQPPVIRAACCVLSNLTTTMSEMTSWAMNQGFSDEEAEKLIVMSLDILEYIKEYAMPHLERTMAAYKEDEVIQTEGLKIKGCFGCHSPSSQHGYKRSGYSSLKRRQHSILKSTETTKSCKGSTPPRRVTFSHELDTQLEMSDTDSEFGVDEPPKRHTVCGSSVGLRVR